ncbi:MAG: dethiobiotin synthase [Chitinispirillales bacterium]|jgi:dethiobiotin synthase|nr:dethiobiotin synthase [Chitinispirillales bacterium]
MTKGIFIAGSGTGVGKTFTSALLLEGFSKLGRSATYMKPVETGCNYSADGKTLLGYDTLYALKFTSYKTETALHSPFCFEPACSPHLAARLSGCDIKICDIIAAYKTLNDKTQTDITIVEGAGGVLVPINGKEFMIDIIKTLKIPVVLVTDPGLGTLNHTFLSLNILKQYGIPVAGVVINNSRNVKRDFIYEDNINLIRRHAVSAICVDIDYNGICNGRLMEFCNEIEYVA